MEKRYVIGIDYSTLSGRALLLDAYTGQERAIRLPITSDAAEMM